MAGQKMDHDLQLKSELCNRLYVKRESEHMILQNLLEKPIET